MAKENVMYVCEQCGAESAKWSGRCNVCGAWNTMVEMRGIKRRGEGRGLRVEELAKPYRLEEIKSGQFKHMQSGIGELDRVLGGGIVPGSFLLLAGDPGIGKSTLVLMLAEKVENVLYVSGEESVEQIKLRAERLDVKNKSLRLIAETNVSYIVDIITREKPGLVIIDSIQTMFDEAFPSTPGSIVQVRECALRLQKVAKALHIPIVIIGHSTKEGSVAGPRTLEHLVDVVLYLEGDRFHGTRILRGIKNRFGATDEIGLFSMEGRGLKEIKNPSALFLAERRENPGSVVTVTMEGSRPLLLEIQALTAATVFGYPRRTASGFDVNRLQLLLATLTNRLKLPLQNQDVYVNVVGGFQLKEPAVDLAVACAVISSLLDKPIDGRMCIYGEVGLGGEIRKVSQADKRSKEAGRIGFDKRLEAGDLNDVLIKLFDGKRTKTGGSGGKGSF